MQQRRRLPLLVPFVLLLGIVALGVFLLLKPMPAPSQPVEKPLDAQKFLHAEPPATPPAAPVTP